MSYQLVKSQSVTLCTIMVCILIMAISYAIGDDRVIRAMTFKDEYGNIELYRFVSPVFAHVNVVHLFFNMVAFFFFASQVERYEGRKSLVVFFFLSAVTSNIFQSITIPSGQFIGMSGVVFALFGYTWFFNLASYTKSYLIDKSIIKSMFFSLAIGYIINALLIYHDMPGIIANTSHVSGLLFGMLYGSLCGYHSMVRTSATDSCKGRNHD